MKKELSYKGYYGSVDYSLENDIFYGKVIGITGLLSYEGQTLDELRKDFQGVVDEYLEDCRAEGVKPEKADDGAMQIFKEMHDEQSNGSGYSSAEDFAENWLKDLKG